MRSESVRSLSHLLEKRWKHPAASSFPHKIHMHRQRNRKGINQGCRNTHTKRTCAFAINLLTRIRSARGANFLAREAWNGAAQERASGRRAVRQRITLATTSQQMCPNDDSSPSSPGLTIIKLIPFSPSGHGKQECNSALAYLQFGCRAENLRGVAASFAAQLGTPLPPLPGDPLGVVCVHYA